MTYRYDETNVLAKQQEENTLQNELSRDLARQVLFRLAPLNQTRLDSPEAAQ
jgi:LPS-assembly lipoprotein